MRHDFLRTPLSIALMLGMSVSGAFAVEKGDKGNPAELVGHVGQKGSTKSPNIKDHIGVTGYKVFDANHDVIGDYDFANSKVIIDIEGKVYSLQVTANGFQDIQITNSVSGSGLMGGNQFPGPNSQKFYTSNDCTGTAYYQFPGAVMAGALSGLIPIKISNPFPNVVNGSGIRIDSNKLYGIDSDHNHYCHEYVFTRIHRNILQQSKL